MKKSKKIQDSVEKVHEEFKDHEVVEAGEKWWKSKSKMFQLILIVAVVLIGYEVLFGM